MPECDLNFNYRSCIDLHHRGHAIIVSALSLLLNLLLAIAALTIAAMANSASISAFAANCLLDVLSSLILLWRFASDSHDKHLERREQIACLGLAIMFIISGLAVIGKSVADLTLISFSSDEVCSYLLSLFCRRSLSFLPPASCFFCLSFVL